MKKQFDTIITLKNRKPASSQIIPVTRRQTKAEMQRRWPNLFCEEPKPLRIGIHKELLESFAGTPFAERIQSMLRKWTRNPIYQTAIVAGGPRYGLDGQPAGEITKREQKAAERWLKSQEKNKLLKLSGGEDNVSPPTQQIPHPAPKATDKTKAPR